MYLAVAAVILGQAAVVGRWVLVIYDGVFGAIVWLHWYEDQPFGNGSARTMRPTCGVSRRGGPRPRQSGALGSARVAMERQLIGIVIPGQRRLIGI
jgi:hypothetical protein